LQPGLFYLRIQRSMGEEFDPLIKYCCTRTVPAAETKSIGLQADVRGVMVFARHLDSFILTHNFSLIWQIRDFGSGQILQPRQF
jgi:hypothetical protein